MYTLICNEQFLKIFVAIFLIEYSNEKFGLTVFSSDSNYQRQQNEMGVTLDRTKNEDCQVKQGKCITTKLNSMMAQQAKALLLYKA